MKPARIASARSKVGTAPSRIIEEVVLDSMIDLRDMLPRRLESISAEEENDLVEHLTAIARAVVSK